MAIDRNYLLRILENVRSFDDTKDWDSLTDQEKNLLEEFAIYYGSNPDIDTTTGSAVLEKLKNPKLSKNFKDVIKSIEAIEASFDEVTSGTIPPEVLAEYQEYLKQQQARSSGRPLTTRESLSETIKKAQYFAQLRLKAEAQRAAHYAAKYPDLDPVRDAATVKQIVDTEVADNNNLLAVTVSEGKVSAAAITQPIAQVAETYVDKVAAEIGVALTPAQRSQAILTLSQFALSGGIDDLVDSLAEEPSSALPAQKIATASQNLVGATTVILRETINPTPVATTNAPHTEAQQELDNFFRTGAIPASPSERLSPIVIPDSDVARIEQISQQIIQSDYRISESLQKASQTIYQVNAKFASSTRTDRYYSVDQTFVTDAETEAVIRAYQADHPGELIKPTLIQVRNAQMAIAAIKTSDPSNKTDPAAINAYHQGVHMDVIRAMANARPGSKLHLLVQKNPNLINRLIRGVNRVENSELGQSGEISTPRGLLHTPSSLLGRFSDATFGRLGKGLTKITESINSRSPALGKVLNFVTNPIQSTLKPLFAWAGKQAGVRAARQFISDVGLKLLKVGSEGLKKLAEKVISKGLQEGIKALIVKVGAALGIDAALAATGVGAPAAVVMIIVQAGLVLAGAAFDFVKKNSKDISEQAIGAVFLSISMLQAGIIALGTAVISVVFLLLIVTVGAILTGIVFYMSTIAMAPIISSIAQLESGIGIQQGTSPITNYPKYTGPIEAGCPSIWPLGGGYVLQGPHGGYSHRVIEAIDIKAVNGTPVKSVSSGIVVFSGWGGVYGNRIDIQSTTESGKSYTVIYGHLSELGVSVSNDPSNPTKVGVGTQIGLSGATSSNANFANPHLHLEYRGIAYNSCPAGGVQVPDGCYAVEGKRCVGTDGKPIYTN